ncbi:hypothetical protein [Glutamicibacter sp. X7]
MPEHVDSPDCGCWGCISEQAHGAGVCVVHAVDRGDTAVPAVASGSRICSGCEDSMRAALRLVVDRWDEAQEALRPSQGGSSSERKTPRDEPPAPVNLKVVDALRKTSKAVHELASRVVDSCEAARLPEDQGTQRLAEWLYRSMIPRIAEVPDAAWVLWAYWLAVDAAEWIKTVTEGVAPVDPVPDKCRHLVHGSACGADLVAVDAPSGKRVVVCQRVAGHSVPWDAWAKSMAARKPRGARPRNHAEVSSLT